MRRGFVNRLETAAAVHATGAISKGEWRIPGAEKPWRLRAPNATGRCGRAVVEAEMIEYEECDR